MDTDRMSARTEAWNRTQRAVLANDTREAQSSRAEWLRLSRPELELGWRSYQETILREEPNVGYDLAYEAAYEAARTAVQETGITAEDADCVTSAVANVDSERRRAWQGIYYADGVQQSA